MRFATLEIDGRQSVVAVDDNGTRFCEAGRFLPGFTGDMVDFIARVPTPAALDLPASGWRPIGEARLCAPIPTPRRNVFCVGKNYHEHAKEFSQSGFDLSASSSEVAPPAPVVFTKAPSTVIACGETVSAFPELTQQLDYEAELGVIIGRAGRHISKEDALDHVWGYTVINDVTARDLQQKHRQWFLGKSMDTFCPMGPWIATADAVQSDRLDVRCWINGELRQDANTRDLIFDIPTIIASISAGMTLQPGDVIATGTPAGVGIGFKPPKFLKAGDEMKIEIESIGTLVNRVA
ncbi:MAG: fumarylacetoacetate hydrolase family protein [Burkholderiaceae bacterium]